MQQLLEQRSQRGENTMRKAREMYLKTHERIHSVVCAAAHGQTMTEYALILAAVAIVAYVTYQVMGQDIGSMVSTIDSALSGA
jgi:Flp pilus assembly pilin Flp